MKAIKDAYARSSAEVRLGKMLLARLERIEAIDRISPGAGFEGDYTVGGVRFQITARVAERGVTQ